MSPSALIGQPPNDQDDIWIIHGGLRIFGIPDSMYDPKTAVIPVEMPPNAPHNSRQGKLVAEMAVCIVLTVLITGTRLCVRLLKVRELQWGADDWAILIAMLGVVSYFGLNIAIAVDGGAGKHMYDITYQEFDNYVSIIFNIQMFYYAILASVKVSIVLFNRRLTGLASRKWMIFHNTMLFILLSYILASILATYFSIWPHPKNFTCKSLGQMDSAPRFLPNKPIITALSVIHMVLDLVLLAVPLIVLYQIQMDAMKKLRLCFLWSIGAVSTIGAIMRVVTQNVGTADADIVYGLVDTVTWSVIDIFFGIIVASLPILNALIPKSWTSSSYLRSKFSRSSYLRSKFSSTSQGVSGGSKQRETRSQGSESQGSQSQLKAEPAVEVQEKRPFRHQRGITEDVEARSGREGRGVSVLPDWDARD